MLTTSVLQINKLGRIVPDRSFVFCLIGRTVVLPVDFEIERPVFGCPAARPRGDCTHTSSPHSPSLHMPTILFAHPHDMPRYHSSLSPSSSRTVSPGRDGGHSDEGAHSVKQEEGDNGQWRLRAESPLSPAPPRHVSDLYFTATVTCHTALDKPIFTITRSDDPVRHVYTSERSASAAWRAALLQACADFPDRTEEIIPGRNKSIAGVNGLMMYGLQYSEVIHAVRALPGAAEMLQRFTAFDRGQSVGSPTTSTTTAAATRSSSAAHRTPSPPRVTDEEEDAHREEPRAAYSPPATTPAYTHTGRVPCVARCYTSVPLPRTCSSRYRPSAPVSCVEVDGESAVPLPTNSTTTLSPQANTLAPEESSVTTHITSPILSPVPNGASARVEPRRAVSTGALTGFVPNTPAPPRARSISAVHIGRYEKQEDADYHHRHAAPTRATCALCGLTGAPFCAVTGEAHTSPALCSRCGLDSAFCPITGEPHVRPSRTASRPSVRRVVVRHPARVEDAEGGGAGAGAERSVSRDE